MNKMIRHARVNGVFAVAVAVVFLLFGCNQSRYNFVLKDVNVSLPKITGSERPLDRAGTPAELLAVRPGGNKTMLVTTLITNNPDKIDDESSETFLAVLDGPPVVGRTYELNPGNCRLILNSVFRPCRHPYRPVEGKIEIRSVSKGKVRAKVVFREMIRWARADSYIVRDVLTFKPVVGEDVHLRQAGIDLQTGAGGS